MKIIIYKGLLWKNNTKQKSNIISIIESDLIAHSNNFLCAERFIEYYKDGTVLDLDINLQIKSFSRKHKTAIVTFKDGTQITTAVNSDLTIEEIKKYYLGKYFNVATYPKEKMIKCISCVVYL